VAPGLSEERKKAYVVWRACRAAQAALLFCSRTYRAELMGLSAFPSACLLGARPPTRLARGPETFSFPRGFLRGQSTARSSSLPTTGKKRGRCQRCVSASGAAPWPPRKYCTKQTDGVDDACDVWGEEAGRKPFTAVPSTVPFASQPSLLPLAPFARRWFATFGGGGTLELLSQPSEFCDLRARDGDRHFRLPRSLLYSWSRRVPRLRTVGLLRSCWCL
jgi:hypothetical protein